MNTTLIVITIYITTASIIIISLYLIQNKKNKKLKALLDNLEFEKNTIDGTPIMSEISKVKMFAKTDKLDARFKAWEKRFAEIRDKRIPKITDMLIEAEYSLSQQDYNSTEHKIAKLEMEIYKVKTNAEAILGEVKAITSSEEKNRANVTKYKTNYRELFEKFNQAKYEYGVITSSVALQFDNIAKRFEIFEKAMDNNDYDEVNKIIKSLEELLGHMNYVIEEVPSIILMATSILPKKIKDVADVHKKMIKEGYPLNYLNVDYNVEEAGKKIEDVMSRAKNLNLEDCLFELKVLLDYFDSLFNDFEKEKNNRKSYDEQINFFNRKLNKINALVSDIFKQMDDIKKGYDLSDEDIVLLGQVKEELDVLNNDYKTFKDHTTNNTFAYSKLIKEVEGLIVRLSSIEDRLDNSLNALGNMKEDEIRARQQLDEVKDILRDSKNKMREYSLPVIPNSYYVELEEASSAIKEIVKELDKKPIAISILNTRVDTARDLVLKLYSKTKDLIKTAMFAEMAIVYGNKYRIETEEINKNLTESELLFFKGEYSQALELTINSLNKIEPGIYDKLLKLYEK